MSKKILFISHSSSFGGTEFVFSEVIRKFDKEAIRIILPEKNDKLYSILSKKYNVKIIKNLWICNTNFTKFFLKLIVNILTSLKILIISFNTKFEIIYSSSSVTVIGIILAIITQKKHIWHIHESLLKKNYEKIIYRYFFKYKKNKIIFVSEFLKNEWEKTLDLKFKNFEILSNPIKKIKKEKKKKDYFAYGFAGTLDKHKNVLELIEVFKKIEKVYQDIKLIIAGNGILYNFIIENSSSTNIKILGNVENMEKFYNEIDVLVVPSKGESFSLVAAEAMSVGIPIIINENIGIKEYIIDMKNGILYKSESKEDLFDKMITVYENKKLYSTISKNSVNTIKKYFDKKYFDKRIIQIFNT